MIKQDFASAVAQFTFSEEERIKKEALRQHFLERFPLSNLAAMTMAQYCLGLEPTENSFCYWLEFKTRHLGGIGGGTANKFIIYFDRKVKEYKFNNRYSTKEEAFDAVKSGLLELARLAENDQIAECEGVPPFEHYTLIRGKFLNLYFPEKFLPISSLDHLKDLCVQLGVQANFESPTDMNLALLKYKQQNSLVADWSNDKFASFLYEKYSPKIQFWKVAPGENARMWQQCLNGGFICIGWSDIGDMRQYKEKEVFRPIYRELHGSNRQCDEIWSFAKEMKKGDIIVANNGLSSIVGVGTVAGDYRYDESRAEYKHCLPVTWDVTTPFSVPEAANEFTRHWFKGTVKKLSRQEYNLLLANGTDGGEMAGQVETIPSQPVLTQTRFAEICKSTFLPEKFFSDCERLLGEKKQIILQGAPGTGKTFVAEHLANLWAGDKQRVKVVQFHESYGYEDFVQGIKPEYDTGEKRTSFVPTPGTFLRFCETVSKDTVTPKPRYVLLIDEINRAKTARVFGELLYLLEYREKEVELQNGERFSIPPNLYIIGTMNTTDKSIALVDYALRRRFAFIDILPIKNGQSVVLRKWLDFNKISNASEVDGLFIALNNAIAQKDKDLMVGHSFFMPKQAVEEKQFSSELLGFMWTYYILPLIAEYEYQMSREQIEVKYGLDTLREIMKFKAASV